METKVNLAELTVDELTEMQTEIQKELDKRFLESGKIKVKVSQRCMDQRELNYEEHSRGTNYIATVKFNPKAAGALDREFWTKASGSYRELPDGLQQGDILEVAYDYTSSGGNRSRRRAFYMVIDISETELSLSEAEKPTP